MASKVCLFFSISTENVNKTIYFGLYPILCYRGERTQYSYFCYCSKVHKQILTLSLISKINCLSSALYSLRYVESGSGHRSHKSKRVNQSLNNSELYSENRKQKIQFNSKLQNPWRHFFSKQRRRKLHSFLVLTVRYL